MTDCIFCKIGSGEIKAEVVYEDDDLVAGQYAAGNGGREHLPGAGSRWLDANKALEITTTAGNCILELSYRVVAA